MMQFPDALRRSPADPLAQARAIITDPALCAARPMLRRLAWAVLKSASGHPVLQVLPRADAPQAPAGWGRDGRTHWGQA